jgi:hypothetical protein
MKPALLLAVAIPLLASFRANAAEKWHVHEWGTFTSLQDESGNAIGGINTDDEPVPGFVHRLNYFLLLTPSEVPGIFFQGAPSCHPDVTMRLETPVIYFHLPESAAGVQNASVRVKFRGGWLSEYYPDAGLTAPGLENGRFQFGRLLPGTVSGLDWNGLQVGGNWPVTNTTAHVWLAPRAVQSALVQTANGESEKFLFYRGVAHIDAPLRVSRDADSKELLFRSQLEGRPADESLRVRSLWLVDIQPDGKLAFRALPPMQLSAGSFKILARTAAGFAPEDYGAGNLDKLKSSLEAVLLAEGLFRDEAEALLNTWQLSYFKSAGLRVFFLVPRAWTDSYLPLDISPSADIQRVMVGRIELVTPRQRSLLQEISGLSTNQIWSDAIELHSNYYGLFSLGTTNRDSRNFRERLDREIGQVNVGAEPLASMITIPPSYRTYLDLGRFRNALILDEAKHHPTQGLTNFIATYGLAGYQPPLISAAGSPAVEQK